MKRTMIGVLAAALAGCGSTQKKGSDMKDPVAELLVRGDVGTDPGWAKVLEEEKHRGDLTAPARMRKLIQSFEVLRIQLHESFRHDGQRASLSWYSGEVGVRGKAEDVGGRLREALQGAGLKRVRDDAEKKEMEFSGGGTTVRVEGPHPWVGGREEACGFRLGWEVRAEGDSAVPTLSEVLKALPMLRDDRVDKEVETALGAEKVAEVSVGGTWTKYYSWSIRFSDEKVQGRLKALLADLGYEPERKERNYQMYRRARTGSYATLFDPEKGAIEISFQPES